jgi:hypothetical protein
MKMIGNPFWIKCQEALAFLGVTEMVKGLESQDKAANEEEEDLREEQ